MCCLPDGCNANQGPHAPIFCLLGEHLWIMDPLSLAQHGAQVSSWLLKLKYDICIHLPSYTKRSFGDAFNIVCNFPGFDRTEEVGETTYAARRNMVATIFEHVCHLNASRCHPRASTSGDSLYTWHAVQLKHPSTTSNTPNP